MDMFWVHIENFLNWSHYIIGDGDDGIDVDDDDSGLWKHVTCSTGKTK